MENIILTNNKDLRLVGVKVGVYSTLRFELPLVPESATHVEVIVTSGGVHSAYTATFISATKFWQCDIAASQFPTVGKQSYEVAYVLDGKQFWDGKGWIEIEDATTSGIEPQPQPEPYRYTVLSVNGYGADAQGAVRIPKTFIATDSPATTDGYMEGDIYFNRETGAAWTLCNVLGTLTWVFNYKNYYTKAETEEAIDKLAAYYITYNAAGAAFPTRADLINAQTYYSGGVARVPTRNDYAVVLADEAHGGAEWRYIYAVADGQTTGQWEAQYPIETNDYDALANKPSINGVTLSGNKTAADLGLATMADATLAERFSAWTLSGDVEAGSQYEVRFDYDNDGTTLWGLYKDGYLFATGSSNPLSTSEDFPFGLFPEEYTITASRTALPGYQLGSQTYKPVASEAEAEALRTGKQNALTAQQLANIAAVSNALAFDATHLYAAGDPVVYNGTLYTFTSAHTGAWTGSDVSAVDIIARLAGKLGNTGNQTLDGSLTLFGIALTNGTIIYNGSTFSLSPWMGGTLALMTHIAPDFSAQSSYEVGQLVVQNFLLKRCTTAGTGSAAVFANATVEDVLAALRTGKADTSDLLAKLDSTSAAPAFSTSSTYAVGDHVTYNGKLYRCTTAVTTAGEWDASKWTAEDMTTPDATLDVTAIDKLLRLVATNGDIIWGQGYNLSTESSATVLTEQVSAFTFAADAAADQAIVLPTVAAGKVGDFILDVTNLSANDRSLTLTGLDSAFSVVVKAGDDLSETLTVAAGEMARYYFTMTAFRVNSLPTWQVSKEAVENGGAQS